jgi:gliding motility-associated lipoprotein GldH
MIRSIKNLAWAAPISALIIFSSCQTIDLYEKTADIPGHAWKSSFKPSFSFTVKDTTAAYQIYLTLRHDDKYSFNNIYVNVTTVQPGDDSIYTIRQDLRLANDEKGWGYSGIGMDDIWDHSLPLTPTNRLFYFRRPGTYTFTVEQLMRQDPLEHVYNVGLRLIKK